MRKTGRALNDLMGKKRVRRGFDVIVDVDGSEVRDSISISNLFVDFFSSIAQSLDSTIPTSSIDPVRHMPAPIVNSIFIMPVVEEEVIYVILSLPNKGGSINSVPVSIYKRSAGLIAPIIVDIYKY